MKIIPILYSVIILILFVQSGYASEGLTGYRNLTSFGCHLEDGTCFVEIDGNSVGASTCISNTIRFNVLNSLNGRNWLSLLQTAYIAKKQVNLNIEGCYVNQPTYPTFNFGYINN